MSIEIERNALPKVLLAMHRKVRPSDRSIWKMYESCEKQSLESASDGSFSKIRLATAPVFPVTALNSDSTTVPRATTAYSIAISLGGDLSLSLFLSGL
jgi:hypothetical protein